ncbi:hypothetical protein [Lederbergia lenta]|uniref:hypothetical protein n=1 Tax=Lederbergia lenta TaxID=1467 RepID=UPI00203EA017|nr:hypothetical protein [Lederbergia lenta]MCM3110010.1 hypothetical protein [Lederbergia lenta]
MVTGLVGAIAVISVLGIGSVSFMNFVNTYEIKTKRKGGMRHEPDSEPLRERARAIR